MADGDGWQVEVIGQERQMTLSLFIEEANAAERVGIFLARCCRGQHDRVIGAKSDARIHRARVSPSQKNAFLGARDEERAAAVKDMKAGEINVRAIHDVEGVGLGHDGVKDIDVVHFSIGNLNESWNWPAQIQQSMQFDGGLPRAKPRPGKHRQAKINGSGIEGVDRIVKIEAERLGSIHGARNVDEHLRKVGEDPPVVSFVSIRQSGARHFAPNAHVVQLAVDRSQAGFDISQTLAVRQLSKCETKELVQAGKSPEFIIAAVTLDALGELVGRNVIDQLREDDAADMHASACPIIRSLPAQQFIVRNSTVTSSES